MVEVFTVAVDEYYFVETYYDTLKKNIESFASNCTVDFDKGTGGLPVSCREECWMTDSKARGCVLVTADVVRSIYCPYSNRRKFDERLQTVQHEQQMVQYECPRHRNPSVSSNLEVARISLFPLLALWGNKNGSPV